jgi:hypothetical protein
MTPDNEIDIDVKVISNQDGTPDPDICEPWSDKSTHYLESMRTEVERSIGQHDLSYYYYTRLDYYIRVPAILVPGAGAPVLILFQYQERRSECDSFLYSEYLSCILLVITSILSILVQIFQFEYKKNQHNMFTYEYQALLHDIDAELIKHKRYRNNVEVVVNTIQFKLNSLRMREPVTPQHLKK